MPVPYYPPMPYHQLPPEMVPYSPAPQQQSELAPLFISQQPPSEPGQFLLQPPAWQEMNYTIPATPLWQPGDPSVQQQYCVYQQQQPHLVPVAYGAAPAAHFESLLATTEQVPQQQQMESQGQVETSSLPMRHFH